MINPISVKAEKELFNYLTRNSDSIAKEIQAVKNMGLDEKDLFVKTIMECATSEKPAMREAIANIRKGFQGQFDLGEAIKNLRKLLPNDAAMVKTEDNGTMVMAKGWEKPILFPNVEGFKWLGWADDPKALSTKEIWETAYGKKPEVIVGAIGNSNIKPEQVLGGCSLSKKELSAMYEKSIVEFFDPIFNYFRELGVKVKDIGFAFAHSDCGVDKASRQVVENHGLRGIATTPTEYTQYLRGSAHTLADGTEVTKADFPYPTVLTRNLTQISDYGTTYGKLVGENNPILVANGGGHAWVEDTGKAIVGLDGSTIIPANLMKDMHGIVIPATTGEGKNKVVTNTSQLILDKIDGNPYEKYKYAFEQYLPTNKIKDDISQYDPQMAMTTHIHGILSKAGLIPKQ